MLKNFCFAFLKIKIYTYGGHDNLWLSVHFIFRHFSNFRNKSCPKENKEKNSLENNKK